MLLAAPLAALLPSAWRRRYPLAPAQWKFAGVASGLLETFAAFAALVEWYSYSMTHWAPAALAATVAAHPEAAINPNAQGFAALLLLLMHPLTWLIIYGGLEGTVRLLAAGVNGTVFGIFPLYLLDRCIALLFLRGRYSRGQAGDIPDDLALRNDAEGAVLEVRAAHAKEGWLPPKIIRFDGNYYRLFQTYQERSPQRSFVYLLRRLSAGVPSWTVINYSAKVRWTESQKQGP
jgi:hypothetical protein